MGKKHREGFTLIELLVLMMVMAIALGVGIPAVSAFIANTRMRGVANELVTSLHAARVEASTRARNVVVCASAEWATDDPGCNIDANLLSGWIVFVDIDADGAGYISFRADGLVEDVADRGEGTRNIQLCDQRGNADTGGGVAAGRWISITPTGRAMLFDKVERVESDTNPLGGC
ncbi:MAG: hypothetical protein FJ197_07240 [Gammaproteobacteria bacterium]|nr:hypothetical protein [Gammaproteobacteria bacterium]